MVALMGEAVRPRLGRRDDMVTCLLGAWMLLGGFVDGWAHLNLNRTDSPLSVWHGVFYTGYGVVAGWVIRLVLRYRRDGRSWAAAVPAGYGVAVAGAAVFAAGGVFDAVWHGLFGVEADVPSLLSPSHFVLAAGMAMMFSAPFRAAWSDSAGPPDPDFRTFLPALGSLTLVVGIVSFFFMHLTFFRDPFMNRSVEEWLVEYQRHGMAPGFFALQRIQDTEVRGLAALLVNGLMLTAPILLCLRRWRVPRGTVTFLFGAVGLLMTGLDSWRHWPFLVSAVVAGLAGEAAVARLPFRLVAAVLPALLAASYVAAMALFRDIGWVVELWTGIVAFSAAGGYALGLLMSPPPVPVPPRP